MVARETDFDDGPTESININDSYFVRVFHYRYYDYIWRKTMIFKKIKPTRNILDKIRFWLYPDKRFEFIALSFDVTIADGEITHKTWTKPNPLDPDATVNYDRITISAEEAFDYFKDNHPEIFEWMLFNLEMF